MGTVPIFVSTKMGLSLLPVAKGVAWIGYFCRSVFHYTAAEKVSD
jgi:hypothetical protein